MIDKQIKCKEIPRDVNENKENYFGDEIKEDDVEDLQRMRSRSMEREEKEAIEM